MRRHLLRPFFDFYDPFLSRRFIIPNLRIQLKDSLPKQETSSTNQQNPYKTFETFFKENGIKSEAQKQFFKDNYSNKIKDQKNPYKILKVSQDASQEQIKNAYRTLALQKHPKNNKSPTSETQFSDLANAYEQCMMNIKQTKQSQLGINSFYNDFDKKIQNIFHNIEKQNSSKQNDNKQIYSQYSHIESENGKNKKIIKQKVYQHNNKTLKVKREQLLQENGQKQIIETIDDGNEVKRKKFLLNKQIKNE